MKKTLLTIAATTAVYAAVVLALVYSESIFIITAEQANGIVAAFMSKEMAIRELYQLLLACKNGV